MFRGLTFSVAHGDDRLRALEFRRTIYEQELGSAGGDRFDAAAHQFVVTEDTGDVVAAFRIVDPAQRPFDMESFFQLDSYVPSGREVGEIARLCVRADRRTDLHLHAGMLKLAYAFCRKRGLSDLVLLALPHLRNFYRNAFFQPLDLTFVHPTWGSLHLMRLDFSTLDTGSPGSRTRMQEIIFGSDGPTVTV